MNYSAGLSNPLGKLELNYFEIIYIAWKVLIYRFKELF